MSAVGAADVSAMAVSLLAVVGLIVAGGFVLRRTPLGAVVRQNGPLKVVATLPLGARERLVLVEARGAELLLAISPAGVFNVGNVENAGGVAAALRGRSAAGGPHVGGGDGARPMEAQR